MPETFTTLRLQTEVAIDEYGYRTTHHMLYGDPHPVDDYVFAGEGSSLRWATLFAAAPLLYAALEALDAWFSAPCDEPGPHPVPAVLQGQARQALLAALPEETP
jgi:hypothetical protein